MDSKKCTKCGELKLLTEFHKQARNKDGLKGPCRACCALISRIYRRTKVGVVGAIYRDQKSNSKKRKMDIPSYSKLELKDWLFNQDLFHELYDDWAESDYLTDLKPSCDRLNDYLPYTFDNMQILTWEKNRAKGHADSFNGVNKKKLRAVIQLNLNGELIHEFYSVSEAGRQTGINQGNISRCCIGKVKTAGGFKWEFKDELEAERQKELKWTI